MQQAVNMGMRQRCLLPVGGMLDSVKAVSVGEFKRCYTDMLAHKPGMEQYNGRVGVAISGGPDSTALLMLMRKAYPNLPLHAYMIDHAMGGIGVGEEPERVKNLMRDLQVQFSVLKVDWSDSPVDKLTVGKRMLKAREKRYEMLAEACQRDEVGLLLLGHNMDDDIVTMFYRMSRFSGLDGISAMRKMSTIPAIHPAASTIMLGRPLLDIEKCRLLATCRDNDIEVTLDGSNDCLEYSRNLIMNTLAELQQLEPERFATVRFRQLLQSMKEHYRTIHERILKAMDESVFLNERQGHAVIIANNPDSINDGPVWGRILSYLFQFVSGRMTPARTGILNEIKDNLQEASREHEKRMQGQEERQIRLAKALPFSTPLPSNRTGRASTSMMVAGGCVVYPLARSDAALRIEAIKTYTERSNIAYGPSFLVQSEPVKLSSRSITIELAANQPTLYDNRFWLHYQTLNPLPGPIKFKIEPFTPALATRFKNLAHKQQSLLARRSLQAFQAVTPGNMLYNVPCVTMPDIDPDYMALPCVGGGVQVGGSKCGMAVQWVVKHAGQPTVVSKFHCLP